MKKYSPPLLDIYIVEDIMVTSLINNKDEDDDDIFVGF